jgi:hypothetical protein
MKDMGEIFKLRAKRQDKAFLYGTIAWVILALALIIGVYVL